MTLKSEHIKGNDQKPKNHTLRMGLILALVILILSAAIALAVYDTCSGLDPNIVTRTAVVEYLIRSGADGATVSTHFSVRFDNGESGSIRVPEGTVFRNGHKVLIYERKSMAFGIKHHTFVKYLD